MYTAAKKLRDVKTVLRAPVMMSNTMRFMDRLDIPYLPPNFNWSQLKYVVVQLITHLVHQLQVFAALKLDYLSRNL
jgi:hypothetical protein